MMNSNDRLNRAVERILSESNHLSYSDYVVVVKIDDEAHDDISDALGLIPVDYSAMHVSYKASTRQEAHRLKKMIMEIEPGAEVSILLPEQ